MLGLYTSSTPSFGMALEEFDQNKTCDNNKVIFHNLTDSLSFSHPAKRHENHDRSPSATIQISNGDPNIVKKLNHNASERARRRKINYLYSSLRSLLPAVDQMKTLSNPATVSRVVQYIPELQSRVQRLIKRKEELIARISRKFELICKERHKRSLTWRSSSAISAIRLNDREIVLQISMLKVEETPLSYILLDLEEDGFSLLNATSQESFGGRIFYTLHLQV